MCRVQSYRQPELSSSGVDRTARKVVKKYRKMTLRREMRRLRRLVLEEGEAGPVSSGQLLESKKVLSVMRFQILNVKRRY